MVLEIFNVYCFVISRSSKSWEQNLATFKPEVKQWLWHNWRGEQPARYVLSDVLYSTLLCKDIGSPPMDDIVGFHEVLLKNSVMNAS